MRNFHEYFKCANRASLLGKEGWGKPGIFFFYNEDIYISYETLKHIDIMYDTAGK